MAHNLLLLRNMRRDQVNRTYQKQGIENACSSLEQGHTKSALSVARRIAPKFVTILSIEPNASSQANLPECTYAPNEGIDKNTTHATVPRIMEYEMIPDTLPHPTRSSITTLRTIHAAGNMPIAKVDQKLTVTTEILVAIADDHSADAKRR